MNFSSGATGSSSFGGSEGVAAQGAEAGGQLRERAAEARTAAFQGLSQEILQAAKQLADQKYRENYLEALRSYRTTGLGIKQQTADAATTRADAFKQNVINHGPAYAAIAENQGEAAAEKYEKVQNMLGAQQVMADPDAEGYMKNLIAIHSYTDRGELPPQELLTRQTYYNQRKLTDPAFNKMCNDSQNAWNKSVVQDRNFKEMHDLFGDNPDFEQTMVKQAMKHDPVAIQYLTDHPPADLKALTAKITPDDLAGLDDSQLKALQLSTQAAMEKNMNDIKRNMMDKTIMGPGGKTISIPPNMDDAKKSFDALKDVSALNAKANKSAQMRAATRPAPAATQPSAAPPATRPSPPATQPTAAQPNAPASAVAGENQNTYTGSTISPDQPEPQDAGGPKIHEIPPDVYAGGKAAIQKWAAGQGMKEGDTITNPDGKSMPVSRNMLGALGTPSAGDPQSTAAVNAQDQQAQQQPQQPPQTGIASAGGAPDTGNKAGGLGGQPQGGAAPQAPAPQPPAQQQGLAMPVAPPPIHPDIAAAMMPNFDEQQFAQPQQQPQDGDNGMNQIPPAMLYNGFNAGQ
jgi:hypothetical protein